MIERTQVVDFVAKGPGEDFWSWVLVEKGPWDEVETELTRLQDRLYDCIDGLIEGKLVDQFPDIAKQKAVLRLDAYNVDENEVGGFFQRFSDNIFLIPDWQQALADSDHIDEIIFEANFERT